MMQPAALVFVVDDDASIRRSLERLLAAEGWRVETFATAEEYLERRRHTGPSCLILDNHLPGATGLELQRQLGERTREEQIIFITGRAEVAGCLTAMKGGAVDYLTKPFQHEELLEAVRRALIRSAAYWRNAGERRAAREKIDQLTARELEVLRYVIAGLLNKQIAAELGTTLSTVKAHRGKVTEKLGLSAVADLVRLAQLAGVAPLSAGAPVS